jgi:hypothetical protein
VDFVPGTVFRSVQPNKPTSARTAQDMLSIWGINVDYVNGTTDLRPFSLSSTTGSQNSGRGTLQTL